MGHLPSQGSPDPKSAPDFHCGLWSMESRLYLGLIWVSGWVWIWLWRCLWSRLDAGNAFQSRFPNSRGAGLSDPLISGIEHRLPQSLPGAPEHPRRFQLQIPSGRTPRVPHCVPGLATFQGFLQEFRMCPCTSAATPEEKPGHSGMFGAGISG